MNTGDEMLTRGKGKTLINVGGETGNKFRGLENKYGLNCDDKTYDS